MNLSMMTRGCVELGALNTGNEQEKTREQRKGINVEYCMRQILFQFKKKWLRKTALSKVIQWIYCHNIHFVLMTTADNVT